MRPITYDFNLYKVCLKPSTYRRGQGPFIKPASGDDAREGLTETTQNPELYFAVKGKVLTITNERWNVICMEDWVYLRGGRTEIFWH